MVESNIGNTATQLSDSKQSDREPSILAKGFAKVLTVAAIPVSIGMGWFEGHRALSDSLYDIARTTEPFRELRKAEAGHQSKLNDIFRKTGYIAGALKQEFSRFDKETKTLFHERDLKYTWQLFNAAPRGAKWSAAGWAFAVFGATAVAMGVIVSIAEKRSIMHLFSSKENDKGPLAL